MRTPGQASAGSRAGRPSTLPPPLARDPITADSSPPRARRSHRIAGDSALTGVGQAIPRLFLFFLNLIVANRVGQLGFGVFSAVLLASQFLFSFLSLGIGHAISHVVANTPIETRRRYLRLSLVVTVGVTVLSVALSPVLARPASRVLGEAFEPSSAVFIGVLVGLQILVLGAESMARGLFRFRQLPLAGLASAIGGALVVAVRWEGLTINDGLAALATSYLVVVLWLLFPLRSELRGGLPTRQEMQQLASRLGMPILLNNAGRNLGLFLPPLLLLSIESGLVQTAIWAAATQLKTPIGFTANAIGNALIPHLSEAHSTAVVARRSEVRSVAAGFAAPLILFLVLAVAASWLIRLFGEEFSGEADLVVAVGLAFLLQAAGTLLSAVLISRGRPWAMAWIHCLWGIGMIALAWGAVSSGGAMGLARLYIWTYSPAVVALLAFVLAGQRPSRFESDGPEPPLP